jgi:hypothetical protein
MGKSENESDVKAGNRNNDELHHTCDLNNLASSVCNLQQEIPYRFLKACDVNFGNLETTKNRFTFKITVVITRTCDWAK